MSLLLFQTEHQGEAETVLHSLCLAKALPLVLDSGYISTVEVIAPDLSGTVPTYTSCEFGWWSISQLL